MKPSDKENVVNQTADTGNDTPDSVPYARFNKQTKQVKSLQTQIDKMKADKKAKTIQDTTDLSEAKNLLAEQSKTIDELTEFKSVRMERDAEEHSSLLEQLPEDERDIYKKLDVDDLKKILTKQGKRQSIPTDKSSPIRGGLKIEDSQDIWDMKPTEMRKNWPDILNFYKNKK